ncbi:hypothetical protein [Desulfocurvus sp. DL9XJH121]
MPDAASATAGRPAPPGLSRGFFRDLASERGALLAAVLRFNAGLGPEGGGNGVPPAALEIMASSPRGRQSRIRLEREPGGFWNFEEESTRLALLEPETLESLALHFGAAVNARSIAGVVAREERARLVEGLGGELVDYALGRGAFHLGETREHFLGRHLDRPLAERVRLHGAEALGICAGRWPADLVREAGRRFPGLFAAPARSGRDHKLERLVWFGLKKLLTKEVALQWAPCFN